MTEFCGKNLSKKKKKSRIDNGFADYPINVIMTQRGMIRFRDCFEQAVFRMWLIIIRLIRTVFHPSPSILQPSLVDSKPFEAVSSPGAVAAIKGPLK